MKVKLRKPLVWLLMASMTFSMLPGLTSTASAAEDDLHSSQAEQAVYAAEETVTVTSAPDIGLPENDELFLYFAEETLYGYDAVAFGTRARNSLENALEIAIYDILKAEIETVALHGGSTTFAMSDISGMKTIWTSEELGVDSIDDLTELKAEFSAQFSLDNIITALLNDCPFDLYWYDKTSSGGGAIAYQIKRSGYSDGTKTYWTEAKVTDLTFTLKVASGYQAGNNTTVTSDVARVSTARDNAQAVVNANASGTAYEKLIAYTEYICNVVSYNHEAADDNYTGGYGDPWQLIYVFDGDSSTSVVCEGYAKAFQYLCDLGGLDCISVSGTMAGGTGSGPHMWNVVTLDGHNYLVDVTNSDDGTIGDDGTLFLVGGTYQDGQYVFTCNGTKVTFTCDNLSLSETDYSPVSSCLKGDIDLDSDVDSDDLTLLARHVGGIEPIEDAAALINADVNEDDAVNSDDLTKHARYVGGIITDWSQE